MPSLDHLKMFVSAAETGSFSAAGRALGKGQSAVSIGISNLETDLGFELFDRTSRKPALTAEGERMLSFARAVIRQVDNLENAAHSVFEGEETSLRITLDDAILLPSVSQILRSFGERFPATQIELVSTASPDIPGLVASGNADIGLMFSGLKIQKGIEQIFIGNLPFVSVCSPDYPLTRLKKIGAPDLLPYRQLLLRSSSGNALGQFPPLSVETWYATSFYTVRELVLQGVGWAYLPAHFVDDAVLAGRLRKLNLRFEHRQWSPPVECVTPKNAIAGPAMKWLSENLRNILSS